MTVELDSTGEKIVKATFKLLQKDGITKATTKKIAGEAGVNEITVFRKFENKKNLIEITKNYYLDSLMNQLEEIFEFYEDETIEEYLKICFYGILNLSDDDFSILKVAMEEVRDIPDQKPLISDVTELIINKLEEFFQLQLDKGVIRDIKPRSLSVLSFNALFQSVILWKVYNINLGFETNQYVDDLLNIIFEGINS